MGEAVVKTVCATETYSSVNEFLRHAAVRAEFQQFQSAITEFRVCCAVFLHYTPHNLACIENALIFFSPFPTSLNDDPIRLAILVVVGR